MTFFESLVLLLLAAVVLLRVASALRLPYPAMLALAGVGLAFIPGAPTIAIAPDTALALFIAPILLDASYDFPVSSVAKLWRPLVVLAVVAVLATAAAVAWIGWAVAGLPVAAALVLGAVVAPPDAAAATAVLGSVSLPRRTIGVLKGESLFNDATALLLFSGALAIQSRGFDGGIGLQLALAVPGGVLLGVAFGLAMGPIGRAVEGTLGGNLLQFISAFSVWIVAERLHLSAVLAVVACGMTVSHRADRHAPRMRVHSFAVWASVVFVLNVLAFMLMGMQARTIVAAMPAGRLWEAVEVAGLVIVAVIAVRFAVVMSWNRLSARFKGLRGDLPPAKARQGVIVAWSGMRGLISLATAFALPAGFPQRDLVVLTAFGVVLATLVIQGATLAPLIRLLRLDRMEDSEAELRDARRALAEAGLEPLARARTGPAAALRDLYRLERDAAGGGEAARDFKAYRKLGLAAVAAERKALEALRDCHRIGSEAYYLLQEEIDWRELSLLPEHERRMEEG